MPPINKIAGTIFRILFSFNGIKVITIRELLLGGLASCHVLLYLFTYLFLPEKSSDRTSDQNSTTTTFFEKSINNLSIVILALMAIIFLI